MHFEKQLSEVFTDGRDQNSFSGDKSSTASTAGSEYSRLPLKVAGEETQEATSIRANGRKIGRCWTVSLH